MKQLFEAQKCNFKSLWYDDEMRGKDAHKREEFTVAGFYGSDSICSRLCLVESFKPEPLPRSHCGLSQKPLKASDGCSDKVGMEINWNPIVEKSRLASSHRLSLSDPLRSHFTSSASVDGHSARRWEQTKNETEEKAKFLQSLKKRSSKQTTPPGPCRWSSTCNAKEKV